MNKKGEKILLISDSLALIPQIVENRNKNALYDINIFAEDFVCELLKITNEDWADLEVKNRASSNYPYVDLGDSKKGIFVQVTSRKDPKKIQFTIDNFHKKYFKKGYEELYVFIIKFKQKKYSTLKIPNNVDFEIKNNILDFDLIIRSLPTFSIKKLDAIVALINDQLRAYPLPQYISDTDGLKAIRDYIKGGVILDDFSVEYSLDRFEKRLNEIIEFLTTGNDNNIIKNKAIFKFKDSNLRTNLESVHESFLELRTYFKKCIKDGVLDVNNNTVVGSQSEIDSIANVFNAKRKAIVLMLNQSCKKSGITEIYLNY